jgi:hypothetical protein
MHVDACGIRAAKGRSSAGRGAATKTIWTYSGGRRSRFERGAGGKRVGLAHGAGGTAAIRARRGGARR